MSGGDDRNGPSEDTARLWRRQREPAAGAEQPERSDEPFALLRAAVERRRERVADREERRRRDGPRPQAPEARPG